MFSLVALELKKKKNRIKTQNNLYKYKMQTDVYLLKQPLLSFPSTNHYSIIYVPFCILNALFNDREAVQDIASINGR